MNIAHYAKAIAAALGSGLTYLLTVLAPEATIDSITLVQWIGFVISVLGVGGIAYAVPNRKPEAGIEVNTDTGYGI